MAAAEDNTKTVVIRQRKPHRKSRLGCGNCKLRSVKVQSSSSSISSHARLLLHPLRSPAEQHLLIEPIHLTHLQCDESKPTCKRCASSGFLCNYTRSTPALQLASSIGGAGTLKLTLDAPMRLPAPSLSRGLPPPAPGLRIPVAGPVAGGPEGSYEMRPADYAALDRFRTRTVFTVGNAATRHLYRDGAFELGVSVCFSSLHLGVSISSHVSLFDVISTTACEIHS